MSNESKFMTPDDLTYYNDKIKDYFLYQMDRRDHEALDIARFPVVPIAKGGTGSTNAADARNAIGAAATSHAHAADDITSGVFDVARIPVDSALSATSVKPVQNKVVRAELASKQDKLIAGSNITIDPNTNEINVVTSADKKTTTPLDRRLKSLDTSVSTLNTSVDRLTRYLTNQTQAALMNQRVHLGEDITEMFDSGAFSARVADGSFDGLSLGQYIEKAIIVEGDLYTVRAILCDANYYYGPLNSMGTVTTPHVACIVDIIGGISRPWNVEWETTGGYTGSNIREFVQGPLLAGIREDFGVTHMVSHGVNISNAIQNGHASNRGWFTNSYGEIMSAAQCCGLNVGNFYDVGEAYRQLALFQHVNPSAVVNSGRSFWLRDICSDSSAFCVSETGSIDCMDAGKSNGVIPLILLK